MCLTPITLKNAKRSMYNDSFTNVVPCGKCVLCLQRRQNSWAFRLEEEAKISESAIFLTFTYAETPRSFNGHETLKKIDYQNFMKRMRKTLKNSKIKYYMCGEYGTETLRPHYHAIMFNLPRSWIVNPEKLTTAWQHGHVDIRPCNTATIRYVTKYLMKGRHEPLTDCDDRVAPFSLMSKKMGLNHLTPQMVKHYTEKMISAVTLPGGQLTSLPRYFRDKIFSDSEKKQLNTEAKQIREFNFEQMFESNYVKEYQWKKNQIRKHEKSILLERSKL